MYSLVRSCGLLLLLLHARDLHLTKCQICKRLNILLLLSVRLGLLLWELLLRLLLLQSQTGSLNRLSKMRLLRRLHILCWEGSISEAFGELRGRRQRGCWDRCSWRKLLV